MNRLSIIDQKNGDQPMSSESGDYKIIFNGNPNQFLTLMKEKDIDIDTNQEIWKVR